MTEQYLRDVLENKAWCPKFADIRLLPCPRPPAKGTLLEKFTALSAANKWTTGASEDHVPDKGWLLSILSTYSPKDEIFSK